MDEEEHSYLGIDTAALSPRVIWAVTVGQDTMTGFASSPASAWAKTFEAWAIVRGVRERRRAAKKQAGLPPL